MCSGAYNWRSRAIQGWFAAGRGVRLDVFARGDGRVYDIEMQVARERGLGRRMRYYQAAMDVGELGSGEDFAAQSEVADRILSTLTPEEVEERNQDVSNRFRASAWVLEQDYWRYLFGDNLPPDGEN